MSNKNETQKKKDTQKPEKDEIKSPSKKEPKSSLKSYKKEISQLNETIKELTDKVTLLTDSLNETEQKYKEAKEDALRHLAELENFKRRKNQEVATFKKFASEGVVTEFLPVIDNFSIAREHAEKNDQAESEIIKGFMLIQKQLNTTLEKLNVTTIEAMDKPFDLNIHQAIGTESKENTESNIVIKEVQKGFKLFDKVIRPAMVIISE